MVERRPYKADATSSSLVPPTRNLRDLRNKRRKSLFLLAVSEEMADASLKFRRNSQEPASGMEPASEKGKRFVFSLSCGDKTATPHDGAFLFQYHPQHVNKKPSPPLEGHTAVPPSPRQKGAPLRNGTSPAPFTANVPPHLALPNISPLHLHMENLNGRLENRPPIWACFLYPKNLGPKNGRLVPFHRLSLPCEGPRACRGFYVWPCHRI